MKLRHEFVEFVPDHLDNGVLYISIQYATASHNCPCGCGSEVVTPLGPTDWSLIFNGITISLDPSIGNWSFHCKSHYWIRKNQVVWAKKWSEEKIEMNRNYDRKQKRYFYNEFENSKTLSEKVPQPSTKWIDRMWNFIK